MRLPNPTPGYDPKDQRDLRKALTDADQQNLKRTEPIVTLNVVNFDTGDTETIQWTNTGWATV